MATFLCEAVQDFDESPGLRDESSTTQRCCSGRSPWAPPASRPSISPRGSILTTDRKPRAAAAAVSLGRSWPSIRRRSVDGLKFGTLDRTDRFARAAELRRTSMATPGSASSPPDLLPR